MVKKYQSVQRRMRRERERAAMQSGRIGEISFGTLTGTTIEELKRLLNVNGGIIFITVDGKPTFVFQLYPLPELPTSPDGR